jgi:hypothetical protein
MTASRKAQLKQVTKSTKRTHTCDMTLSMYDSARANIQKKIRENCLPFKRNYDNTPGIVPPTGNSLSSMVYFANTPHSIKAK